MRSRQKFDGNPADLISGGMHQGVPIWFRPWFDAHVYDGRFAQILKRPNGALLGVG